ncbi:hypothetical protein KIH39_02210 [Telmatocola sphagniphila]|uniref:Deoxyhypusine synthase n=1 Tax=Telmatocola sphagniphila TaxID=1123043 RepID=A0A8E6EVI2_9BACT|nr:hypothetical protein [Telmatocola sphagniphila]QVL32755.1 hypothetical protein KIH39_02210 [Telmatocola sphagniphila]
MPYPLFDRSKLKIQPLQHRQHDLDLKCIQSLDSPCPEFEHHSFPKLAEAMLKARRNGRARMIVMGAHVLRAGVVKYLIDWMERGLIDLIALNGAGPIHDWEFARIGASTESVARYIRSGEFGLWRETAELNDIVKAGVEKGMGLGESIGKEIAESSFPHKEISLLAAGYRLKVPITVHVGIGYDILHEHPNFDGAAFGRASYTDFLIFAEKVRSLEGGLMLNFGSAVMGPEVYLKALSMARNVAHQNNEAIKKFTTAVFDLIPIEGDYHQQAPKTSPQYYYRPWKTILVRTVADGGESHYIAGDHRLTVPRLWHEVNRSEKGGI